MIKHGETASNVRVLDGQHRVTAIKQAMNILPEYDATVHVGLRTIIYNAAIERIEEEETTIEIPKVDELRAAAAVMRCLMRIRLRGPELKAIRKILGLTMADFAKKLDERTAAETVSRWESETQPMGGYAEKTLRLFVCEELREKCPGVAYTAKMISDLRILDPWRVDSAFVVPPLEMSLIKMKEQSGDVVEAYNDKKAA